MKRAATNCNEGYAESMSTQTITEFLEARIAEDEARASSGWARLGDSRWETTEYGQDFLTPSAVLAECAAKRAIVEKAKRADVAFGQAINPASSAASFALTEVLHYLASVYKDHADYQEDWAL